MGGVYITRILCIYLVQNIVFALFLLPLWAAWVTQRQSFTRFYCQSKREHNRFAVASLCLAFLECLAASDSPCLFYLELLTSSHSFQVSHLARRDLSFGSVFFRTACEQFHVRNISNVLMRLQRRSPTRWRSRFAPHPVYFSACFGYWIVVITQLHARKSWQCWRVSRHLVYLNKVRNK